MSKLYTHFIVHLNTFNLLNKVQEKRVILHTIRENQREGKNYDTTHYPSIHFGVSVLTSGQL